MEMVKLFKNKILFIVSFLTLIGCNDSNTLTNNYFLGDSIVKRWDIKQYFPTNQTINLGISGATIEQIRVFSSQLNYKNDNCFLLIGTNNCLEQTEQGLTENQIYSNIKSSYENLFLTLNDKFNKIYVISLLPLGHQIDSSKGKYFMTLYPKINNWLNTYLSEFGNKYYLINVYNLFLDNEGYMSNMYSLDGVHPNNFGYSIISMAIIKYVQ